MPLTFAMFPFCIPWDVYDFLSAMTRNAVAPKFEINLLQNFTMLTIESEPWVFDFDDYTEWVLIVRWGMYGLFCIFLILGTKKLLWTGGG